MTPPLDATPRFEPTEEQKDVSQKALEKFQQESQTRLTTSDLQSAQRTVDEKFGKAEFTDGSKDSDINPSSTVKDSPSAAVRDTVKPTKPESRESGDRTKDTTSDTNSAAQKRIADRYGVEIVRQNGKYEYRLNVDGQEKTLFRTDASDRGLKEADDRLKQMVNARIKTIENKHGVQIKKEGEPTEHELIVSDAPDHKSEQKGDDQHDGHGERSNCATCNGNDQSKTGDEQRRFVKQGDLIPARSPSLGELEALDRALERSGPSAKTGDPKKPLTISFLSRNLVKGEPGGEAAYNNRSQTIVIPPSAKNLFPTESVRARHVRDDKGPPSLEYVLVHELAHNAQNNIGLFPENRNEQFKKYADSMGWTWRGDGSKPEDYELKGKDGYQYQANNEAQGWVRRDKEGNYITSDGQKTTDVQKAHKLSVPEMREMAVVKPSTHYFTVPEEMGAEAMAQFRMGDERRAKLLKDSPKLHEEARKYDQIEIDKIYGTNSDGSSKLIRLPNGRLTANTEANREKIAIFERRFRSQAA